MYHLSIEKLKMNADIKNAYAMRICWNSRSVEKLVKHYLITPSPFIALSHSVLLLSASARTSRDTRKEQTVRLRFTFTAAVYLNVD